MITGERFGKSRLADGTPRIVMHVDMDAFFASVEQQCNPKLAGLPVAVAGDVNTRTAIASASYEARAFGVKAGMPLYKARQLCPSIVFVNTDADKYVYYSRRVMDIFRRVTPVVEPFSIDEAFLDVTGSLLYFGGAKKIAELIKAGIKEELGITCSIGVSYNRLVAKIASKIRKPDGFTVIAREDFDNFVKKMDIEKLWGIGRKLSCYLRVMRINTIGQLAEYGRERLVIRFGKIGDYLHCAANGIDDSVVTPEEELSDAKSVGHETTLQKDCADPAAVESVIFLLSDRVARRMRISGYYGNVVHLKVRFADFFTFTRMRTINSYTNVEKVIFENARGLFEAEDLNGRKIRLVGVSVGGIVKFPFAQQEDLFCERGSGFLYGEDSSGYMNKMNCVRRAMDSLKDRYGERVINYARIAKLYYN